MPVWSSEIKELESLHTSIKGRFPGLEKELNQLIETKDANVVMLYSRRCLEIIITDLCECELKRPRKTEPLKGIIDKLHHEEKVPGYIITSMHGLNDLSTYGAHPKEFDPRQVKPVLNNLTTIIDWYLKYKDANVTEKIKPAEEKTRPGEPLEEVRKELIIEGQPKPTKLAERKMLSGAIVIVTILIIAAILAYPKIFKHDTIEKLRSSGDRIAVAVMPFQNMTNDTAWNLRQYWIQDILINSLANSENLQVRQAENINNLIENQGIKNYASISPSVAGRIAEKLDANVFISGNIKLAGSVLRLNAQMVDSKSEDVFKSFQIEGSTHEEKVFHLIDSLSSQIKDFLLLSRLKQAYGNEANNFATTNSAEAFQYFMNGKNFFYKQDYESARNMFFHGLAVDSSIYIAYIFISASYENENLYDDAKKWCLKAYNKREQMPILMNQLANWLYANLFGTPHEETVFLRNALEIDDQHPTIHFLLGNAYIELNQYEKAIPEYEKALEIFKKWGIMPYWVFWITYLGDAYHKMGMYKEEKKLYHNIEQDFPDNPSIIYNQAVLALSEGKTKEADYYIEKYKSILKESSVPESGIINRLANIYSEAGKLNKAEENYRQALSFESENPDRLNNLAYFLIDKDRNIDEGLELIDKALNISPDNYNYLDTKGWGLYRQGNSIEALEILQKSWDLRRQYAIYDHEAYLHLEETKKAVAIQKNN